KVVQHRLGGVDGDGKADARRLVHSIVGRDHRCDPDHLAARVQQRAARVARVHRGIGLDRVLDRNRLLTAHGADRRDDAARHGPVQPEGIADRVDLLSHDQVRAGLRQSGRHQVWCGDFHQREIVPWIHRQHLPFVRVLIPELHLDGAALISFDYVVIRQDQSVFIEDEARALPLLRNRPIEEIERYGRGGDVHDAGQRLLVHGDVLLLFLVERWRGRGHGQVQAVRATYLLYYAGRRGRGVVQRTEQRRQR